MSSIGQYDYQQREQDDIGYGTHTLPQKFWTIPRGSNLLNDPAYRARRREKHARHLHNQQERADRNRAKGR